MQEKPICPKSQSLKRYGLTQEDWVKIAERQGNVCPICGRLPENKRLVTDHVHVKGFKHMPIKNKPMYVRGVCCLRCNLMYLPVGITVEKAKNVVSYLEAYEKRYQEALAKTMPSSLLDKK